LPSEAPLLAFDASGPWLAASVAGLGAFETMERGQAEALMPWLEALLSRAGLGWRDLGGLAVGIGPGNFTGVRIAVAAARGLALGLGRPCWGLSAFALLRAPKAQDDESPELLTLPAPRGMVQGQVWRAGGPDGAPMLLEPDAPGAVPGLRRVRGHDAARLGAALGVPAVPEDLPQGLPARLAASAARARDAGPPAARPAPLHVRPPDAAPPAEAPPCLIG
jgi:tRNA threonylcarbamoyladenosine biosynthesis protein TsaB